MSARISDALRDAIRALQTVVFQETGQAGQLVAIVIGRELGKEFGLHAGSSVILRGAPCDLRVTVESEALDAPLANRVAVLERAVANLGPVTAEPATVNPGAEHGTFCIRRRGHDGPCRGSGAWEDNRRAHVCGLTVGTAHAAALALAGEDPTP